MKSMTIVRRLALGSALLVSAAAQADFIYVGSWHVGDGPQWSAGVQTAYSGLEAAALLFGGSPADYVISTISSDPGAVNFMTWMDRHGYGITGIYAQDFENGDLYTPGVYSSYILDNSCFNRYSDPSSSCEDQYINYAFRIERDTDVPEPAPLLLMALGLGLAGWSLSRKRAIA